MKKRYIRIVVAVLLFQVSGTMPAQQQQSGKPGKIKTFCNPLDLPYRFQLDGSQREAADPVVVLYRDMYWLFASKSGGYWSSADLLNWKFIEPVGLPLEIYAPAIVVLNSRLFYLAGDGVYSSDDPGSGKWVKTAKLKYGVADPSLFLDNDGRLYLYHGCNENKPLYAVELDTQTFLPIGKEYEVIRPDMKARGWEVAGEDNLGKKKGDTTFNNLLPWIEGSWMNKINGKYYLQYAGPGTQFKSYADGVFVSDSPLGPFEYAKYSPFSYKPAGFVTGVGHSSTFADKTGNFWHITSAAISVRQMFERRLALFPAGLLPNEQLTTNTYLGDYPQYAPGTNKNPLQGNSPGWMLLSYHKPALASSTLVNNRQDLYKPANAFDERITSWWAAATGNKGEWLQVDLTKSCLIYAIQLNFADQGAQIYGRLYNDGYQYIVEVSSDGSDWNTVVDRSDEARDEPHHYIQLENPVYARFVRITNVHSPAGSVFSMYDLRIFGLGQGKMPAQVKNIQVLRDKADQRHVTVSWDAAPDADFYIVRYGLSPRYLCSNYQVFDTNSVTINSLNTGVTYYFTVDAVNDSGITKGVKTIQIE